MKSSFLSTIATCALIVSSVMPFSGQAATLTLNGDDTTSATFNRPTESGASSFQNPRFDAYGFVVNLDGDYSFGLVAADPANFDTFIHLYQTGFNPADPEANFLRANDDGPGGADAGSALSNVHLVAGTQYYVVADGFSALDYGAYTATISGPGNITAVPAPEPSSTLLIALAAAFGGWLLVRRARQNTANGRR